MLILADFEDLSTSMVSKSARSASRHRRAVKSVIPDPLALGCDSPGKVQHIHDQLYPP